MEGSMDMDNTNMAVSLARRIRRILDEFANLIFLAVLLSIGALWLWLLFKGLKFVALKVWSMF